MREIDNFYHIKSLLTFDSPDDFYHLQIIKRKKENPELGSNSYIAKTYYINSLEQLEFYHDEIIGLCKLQRARACINLNKRSFEAVAFHTLKKVTDQIMNKDWRSVRKAYTSVCGATSNAKKENKKWIIDIDILGSDGAAEIARIVGDLPEECFVKVLPTKNGSHLITRPFNLQEFNHVVKMHDVHKNNPTILYIPNISDK